MTIANHSVRRCISDLAASTTGFLLIALFIHSIGVRDRAFHSDDIDYIYMGSWAWVHHIAPYGHVRPPFSLPGTNLTSASFFNPGYYFPPFCAMLFAPLTWLPLPAARLLLLYVAYGAVLAGAWSLSQVAFPKLRHGQRLLLIGAVSCSGPLHWMLYLEQPSALFVGALFLFGAAALRRRWSASFAMGALVSIKMSLFFPVAGIFLWHKKYRLLALLIVTVIALNVVAALHTGVVTTVSGYIAQVGRMNAAGSLDRPDALKSMVHIIRAHPNSPLHPLLAALGKRSAYELNYTFLFTAWTKSLLTATWLGWVAGVASILVLFYTVRSRWLQNHSDIDYELLLFSCLCTLSLLTVYHGKYDLLVLVPGAMSSWTCLRHTATRRIAAMSFVLSLFLSCILSVTMLDRAVGALAISTGIVPMIPLLTYCLIMLLITQFKMLAMLPEERLATTATESIRGVPQIEPGAAP